MADERRENPNADDVLDLDPTSFVDDVYNAVCVVFCWFGVFQHLEWSFEHPLGGWPSQNHLEW
jgi:hypothetical protein